MRQGLSRHRAPLHRPARRRHAGHGQDRLGEPAQPLRPAGQRRLRRQRIGRLRHAAGPARRRARGGKVKFVGFDSGETLVAGLKTGRRPGPGRAGPVQDGLPRRKTAVAAHPRREIPGAIDTGVGFVTTANFARPEMADIAPSPAGQVSEVNGQRRACRPAPSLRLAGIRKSFGATQALKRVSLESRPARSMRSSARTARARAP